MPYRRIKTKERSHGMKFCTLCKPTRVKAIYRNTNVPIDKHVELACEAHVGQLKDWPHKPQVEQSNEPDDQYTEADYQTWLNL